MPPGLVTRSELVYPTIIITATKCKHEIFSKLEVPHNFLIALQRYNLRFVKNLSPLMSSVD